MRRWWPLPMFCATLIAVPLLQGRRKSEIDAVPDLLGLPMVEHQTAPGGEVWTFTGPGQRLDVVARLKPVLAARGWNFARNAFSYGPPAGGLWSRVPLSRDRSELLIDIVPGRALVRPPPEPVRGEWTTIHLQSVQDRSVLAPRPRWRVYR